MPIEGYVQDLVTRIINVKWGLDVIVVFADAGTSNAPGFQVPSVYTPEKENEKEKARLLDTFYAPYQAEGFQPGYKCFAYLVSATANEFMTVNWPGIEDVPTNEISMHVFAMDDDIDKSLERARDGVKLIIPSMYRYSHSSSDIPAEIAPPGLLWSIASNTIAGREVKWKIRFGIHRNDENPEPPNVMVQCYPLDTEFSVPGSPSTTWGYAIMAYRLDRNGTATVYGWSPDYLDTPQHIDPIWNQSINSAGRKGIPFADPPPLINSDVS